MVAIGSAVGEDVFSSKGEGVAVLGSERRSWRCQGLGAGGKQDSPDNQRTVVDLHGSERAEMLPLTKKRVPK
jgi:hypothetical protein